MPTPVSAFGTFINSNPPLIVRPGHVFNAAQRQNYAELGYFWRGQKQHRVMQGGATLQGRIYLFTNPRAEVYDFADTVNPVIVEPGINFSLGWQKLRTWIAWQQEIIDQQMSEMTRDALFEKWWDVKDQYYQDMYTDWYGKVQDLLWAVPNRTLMEGTTATTQPYSIPCFINEFASGLSQPGAANGGTWTQVHGIAPATTQGGANWAPQLFTYDNLTVNSPTNLLNAIDNAIIKGDFRPPPQDAKWFESELATPGMWFACSATGKVKLEQLYRASNDRWDNPQDPAGNPTYRGIPFVYCAKLDTAAIFPTAAAGALSTELNTAFSNGGPRFWGIDSNHLNVFTHRKWFMLSSGEMSPFNQPTKVAIFFHTMLNMMCSNRRSLLMIFPTANIV